MAIHALAASAFLAAIGVNTHLNYTDGAYRDVERVIRDLSYVGITHIRDNQLTDAPGAQGKISYEAVAGAGVKLDFIVSRDPEHALDLLDAFSKRHSGAIDAIEGPNEINNAPVSFANEQGCGAAHEFQATLFRLSHAKSGLARTPVWMLTGQEVCDRGVQLGSILGLADAANMHPYPVAGEADGLALFKRSLPQLYPGLSGPFVLTETGYPDSEAGRDGVSTEVQAKGTLNLWVDAVLAGASRIYVYELLDAYRPDSRQTDAHFGLFDWHGQPKPVAHAIRNVGLILEDRQPFRGPAPQPSYDLLPAAGHKMPRDLLLEQKDGSFSVIVEPQVALWDAQARKDIVTTGSSMHLRLKGAALNAEIFDPLVSDKPVATFQHISDLAFNQSDHIIIVRLY